MIFQTFIKILLIICFLLSFTNNSVAAIDTGCDQVLKETEFKSETDLLHIAETYQRSGQYKKSIQALCLALQKTSEQKYATLLGSLGHTYFMLGDLEQATILLEQSTVAQSQQVAAIALNNLGNICSIYEKADLEDGLYKTFNNFQRACITNGHSNASKYYRQSAELAIKIDDNFLAIKALLNLVQITKNNAPNDFYTQTLFQLSKQIQNLEPTPEKIQALLRLGRVIILTSYPNLRDKTYDVLQMAQNLAQEANDMASVSQALGYIGQLYQQEKRYQEALNLTRQAIFSAQEIPELLYYWQWQLAKIFHVQGEYAKSALAYAQATDILWSIRYDLSKIYRIFHSSFREQVIALFDEFTELLLTQASNFSSTEKATICHLNEQGCLKTIQDILEKLKAAELMDYFQNECIIENQMSLTEIELGEKTAVLYPIMLEDRLELLLHKADGITLTSVITINRQKLETEADNFRKKLNFEEHLGDNFKQHSQNLYNWLIQPLANHLQNIETLVFVLDGKLRSIPIAALYDGKDYLINQYSLAIVPGLTLRMTSELRTAEQSILLAGLDLAETVKINDYTLSALNTTHEIKSIKKHFSKTTKLLLNDKFSKIGLQNKMIESSYSIVHISSHAVFESDIKNSFILMSKNCPLYLEQFGDVLSHNLIHDNPLGLITLSACETARGDDRAALGLGGIAFRTGAQNVVATLWKVDSNFTAKFMPIFYENISKGLPKSKSLQEAQLNMLNGKYYQHPYFWSAFILIGNWL